ncbi:hypothetical protein KKC44_03015 [Patescibacteria group bacterium]|nr:hypothetical protein [Patescibacteria group bacterium]MBU2259556.1 hypothetical protein [Patescibacteria group bacterium]
MLTVSIPIEGESWGAFARRIEETDGDVLIILPSAELMLPPIDEKAKQAFFHLCATHADRVQIATFKRSFQLQARAQGIEVLERVGDVRELLKEHQGLDEALRALSPHVWKQQLRSRLQSMGLLSLPKLRIWVLIVVSSVLFFFILFKLLPSAEIRIWPRGDSVSQTVNIFLVQSGAVLDASPRVRTLDLVPLTVTVDRKLTFDRISKDFIGSNASVEMTIINKSDEEYQLRKGSRLVNQAGMVFRITEQVFVDAGREVTVISKADDTDLYGEIIGERGNVPSGLKWEFTGLSEEEQKLVYGENRSSAQGGTTAYTNVLKNKDLELAELQLKQDLLATANQMLDEELTLINSTKADKKLERLYYEEFTSETYSGFVLPTQFIGEEVASVPIEGTISFTAYAYDKLAAMYMLYDELKAHVEEGRRLLDESVNVDRLVHHVIDYADDISWIKLTVDLSGKEEYILDPLTPYGAHFAMNVRDIIAGKSKDEAVRIVKNLPEVDNAQIKLWPPWARTLPGNPSQISITPVDD